MNYISFTSYFRMESRQTASIAARDCSLLETSSSFRLEKIKKLCSTKEAPSHCSKKNGDEKK